MLMGKSFLLENGCFHGSVLVELILSQPGLDIQMYVMECLLFLFQAALLVGGVESENISIDKESTHVNFKFLPKAVCIKVNQYHISEMIRYIAAVVMVVLKGSGSGSYLSKFMADLVCFMFSCESDIELMSLPNSSE